MNTEKGNLKMLIKVAPDSKAEEYLMSRWGEFVDKWHVTEAAVQLGVLFGRLYNMYVVDFKTEKELRDAFVWMAWIIQAAAFNEDYLTLKNPKYFQPEVTLAYERPLEEEEC